MPKVTLEQLMDKRPLARITKYNQTIATVPISEMTVETLSTIGLQIMGEYYAGKPVPTVFIPAEALRILHEWAQDKKLSII